MAFKKSVHLNILLFAMAAVLSSASVLADKAFDDWVCKDKNFEDNFCYNVLGKAVYSDLSGLANYTFNIAKGATDTNNIKALIGKESNTQIKRVLEDCLANYGSAAQALAETWMSFSIKNYIKMLDDASKLQIFAVTCDYRLIKANSRSLLYGQNKELKNSAHLLQILADYLFQVLNA